MILPGRIFLVSLACSVSALVINNNGTAAHNSTLTTWLHETSTFTQHNVVTPVATLPVVQTVYVTRYSTVTSTIQKAVSQCVCEAGKPITNAASPGNNAATNNVAGQGSKANTNTDTSSAGHSVVPQGAVIISQQQTGKGSTIIVYVYVKNVVEYTTVYQTTTSIIYNKVDGQPQTVTVTVPVTSLVTMTKTITSTVTAAPDAKTRVSEISTSQGLYQNSTMGASFTLSADSTTSTDVALTSTSQTMPFASTSTDAAPSASTASTSDTVATTSDPILTLSTSSSSVTSSGAESTSAVSQPAESTSSSMFLSLSSSLMAPEQTTTSEIVQTTSSSSSTMDMTTSTTILSLSETSIFSTTALESMATSTMSLESTSTSSMFSSSPSSVDLEPTTTSFAMSSSTTTVDMTTSTTAMMTTTTSVAPVPSPLIVNGGFETGFRNPWRAQGTFGGVVRPAIARSGSFGISMQAFGSPPTPNTSAGIVQTFRNAVVDQRYVVEYYVKVPQLSFDAASSDCRVLVTAQGNQIDALALTSLTTQFFRSRRAFTATGTTGDISIVLSCDLYTSVPIYVDDVSVTPILE